MTTFTGDGNANTANATNGTLNGFTGGSSADLTDGTADLINGLGGHDTIIGGGGDDTINGGEGDDLISGRFGFDMLDGGNGIDTHSLTHFDGATNWDMTTGVVTFEGFATTETALNFENAILGNGADTITGNAAANYILGNGGADALSGGLGNDTLEGGSGVDLLEGGGGADSLNGGSEGDEFVYTSLSDAANDTIDGGSQEGGRDTLVISVGPGDTDFSNASIISTGTTSIEGLRFGNVFFAGAIFNASQFNETGISTALNIRGVGVAANVTINNANGLFSAAAFTFENWFAINRIFLNGGTGNDSITGSTGTDWIFGGGGNDLLEGGLGNDLLEGGLGDDSLVFDAGADSLVGNEGNDTFFLSDVSHIAGDTIDGGADNGGTQDALTISSSGAFNLTGITFESVGTTSIERLTLSSFSQSVTLDAGQFSATGISTALTLRSTLLNSGVTVVINNANGTFNASAFQFLFWDASNERLEINGGTGADNITGTTLWDRLNGGGGSDTLQGGNGDDTLGGGAGSDLINGGFGNDLIYGHTQALQTGVLDGDTLSGDDGNDVLISADGADVLFGGTGNDTLEANSGNDSIYGGTGNDSMTGGFGNDHFVVNDAGDIAVEGEAEGEDTSWVGVSGWTNGAHIEIVRMFDTAASVTGSATNEQLVANAGLVVGSMLDGAGGDDVLWGSAFADTLIGGEGADVFRGGAGADSMVGGAGVDIFVVNDLGDVITELAGGGFDTAYITVDNYVLPDSGGAFAANLEVAYLAGTAVALNGSSSAENMVANPTAGSVLAGLGGNDILYGSNFADTLTGGIGSDQLNGYGGADLFRFFEAVWGNDWVLDFSAAQGDKLVFGAASGVTSFGQLVQGTQDGWLLLSFGGNSIWLYGAASITAADVVFSG